MDHVKCNSYIKTFNEVIVGASREMNNECDSELIFATSVLFPYEHDLLG